MWDTLFSVVNIVALIAWAMLLLLPRTELVLAAVLYLGVGLLCLVYAVCLAGILGGVFDPVGPSGSGMDFTTIAGVQSIFGSQGGTTVGWTHYLAFDLFVGIWIARDADQKGVGRAWQALFLVPTFLAGPVGLLIWLLVRERYRGPRTSESPLRKFRR
ncbi:ABA4-like family protein [Parerythrobacter aurantius]|uniref:ABA4-like family protein n=1 Tax=Parerythrobacter aurantius TaxID=3127706 RepID=UPI00325693D4